MRDRLAGRTARGDNANLRDGKCCTAEQFTLADLGELGKLPTSSAPEQSGAGDLQAQGSPDGTSGLAICRGHATMSAARVYTERDRFTARDAGGREAPTAVEGQEGGTS